ncbi:calcium/sodium antiporter [Candidatus Nomurabacteria bacterium]|nr:calcium/sodium antiporter [Candidatus Nomurabacteria bacterium]
MTLTYILFFIGFFALIKGADWLVTGASALAGRWGVSALVIGLTIVSFGTSAPELVVNILASLNGNTDIAIGNVVGSNIANILLILGVSAAIYPLTVQKGTVWKEIPFALLAVVVLGFMANDAYFDGATTSALTRIDGLVLISFFVIFMYYIFGLAKSGDSTESAKDEESSEKVVSVSRSLLMVVGGTVGLVVGGKWIVDGAIAFATNLGVSEALIGLTIVAIGTSLPELATSAVAAYRKNVDIAVGNIVGSNIFNIFWILGVSAIIKPLPFSPALTVDIIVTIVATALLFFALFIGRRHTMERWQGAIFIVLYVAYIVFLIFRG